MTKTMNHTNCTHPATRAGRAACRKDRAAQVASLKLEALALIDSYYDNSGDYEEIIHALMRILPAELTTAYFDTDADADELISLANSLRIAL